MEVVDILDLPDETLTTIHDFHHDDAPEPVCEAFYDKFTVEHQFIVELFHRIQELADPDDPFRTFPVPDVDDLNTAAGYALARHDDLHRARDAITRINDSMFTIFRVPTAYLGDEEYLSSLVDNPDAHDDAFSMLISLTEEEKQYYQGLLEKVRAAESEDDLDPVFSTPTEPAWTDVSIPRIDYDGIFHPDNTDQ